MNKKWMVAAGVLAVFFIVGGLAVLSLKQSKTLEVDLTKNIQMEFHGLNGEGYARVKSNNLDLDLSDDNCKKFLDSLSYKIEPSEDLWNGSEVLVTVGFSKSISEAAGLQPVNTEAIFMVDGLETANLSKDVVPEGMRDTEGQEVYKEYMEALENMDEDEPEAYLGSFWIQGEDPEASKKEEKVFLFEEYSAYTNDAFDQAKEYGRTSSQKYRVQPVMDGDGQVGWKTIFEK